MHEHIFLTHTLIRSLQTIRTFRILDAFWYCSGVHVIVRFARSWSFLSFWFWILASFYSCFCTFLDLCISDSVFIPVLFIWYHAWMFICDIAVIVDILWLRFIACSGYFRLTTYLRQVIFTLQCTYTIHTMIRVHLRINCRSFLSPSLESIDASYFNIPSSSICIFLLIPIFHLGSFSPILTIGTGFWTWSTAEIRARSGIVLSQRGDVKACLFSPWTLILLSFPTLLKFRGRNFL